MRTNPIHKGQYDILSQARSRLHFRIEVLEFLSLFRLLYPPPNTTESGDCFDKEKKEVAAAATLGFIVKYTYGSRRLCVKLMCHHLCVVPSIFTEEIFVLLVFAMTTRKHDHQSTSDLEFGQERTGDKFPMKEVNFLRLEHTY